jgi:hypothetical protein
MIDLNRSLAELVKAGEITVENAYRYSLILRCSKKCCNMLFNYKAIDTTGTPREGTLKLLILILLLTLLQRRGLIISSIQSPDDAVPLLQRSMSFSC